MVWVATSTVCSVTSFLMSSHQPSCRVPQIDVPKHKTSQEMASKHTLR